MRILYLVPDFFGPGGIARHARVVCQALLEANIEVEVLALNDKGGRSASGSEMLRGLSGMNYRACHGSRKTFVRQALALARKCPQLVLVEHANFSPLGWLVALLSRSPWAVVAHGIEVWEPLSHSRQWTLRRANRVICVSHFTAGQIAQSSGVLPKRTRVLHNCLDPHFAFQQVTRSVVSPSLLTVGRTTLAEQYKGHDVVIRALPQLLSQFPDLIYHIIGDGDGRPKLQQLALEQGVAESIRWSAHVSEEELAHHYAHASLFIMPSRGEGFGLVFVEAMAQGVPAIGGNQDATPEVIADGKTGYIIDPNSVESVVEATARLLGDAELRECMGQAARLHVEREFSFGKFQETLLGHLGELGLTSTASALSRSSAARKRN